MATDHQWCGDPETLRSELEARRRQLNEDLTLRIMRIREHGSHATPATDLEEGDACDLDLRLVEIANATLRRVDHAIARLDDGTYGRCTRCHGDIAAARLRAMPFAVRCQRCEMAREHEAARRSLERSRLCADGFGVPAVARPDEY